jgi:hypothetical protein
MPMGRADAYVQTVLFLDAFDLTDEMPSMTEKSVEEHSINSTDVMVDHLVDQQFSEHLLIQVDTF